MNTDWRNKRVLVTGGSGFIGSFVSEALVKLGAQVRITTTGKDTANIGSFQTKIQVFQGDLQDEAFALRALKDQDAVFHLASLKRNVDYHRQHPADLLRINTLIAINVLESARIRGANHLLIASTNIIDSGVLADEHSPHYGYAWSKLVSEVLAKAYRIQYGMKIVIARPSNVYGPRDNFNFAEGQVIPSVIARVFAGEDPIVMQSDGTEERSFIYVEDVATTLLDILAHSMGSSVIDITGAQSTSIHQLVNAVVRLSGVAKPRVQFSKPVSAKRVGSSHILTPEAEDSAITLERDLDEGLARTIEWYKSALKRQGIKLS